MSAQFTIKLKDALEATGGSSEVIDGVRVITGGNIGLDHYPIFDEVYRASLNGKILDRYLNREIGLETIEMFQLAMRRRMNEIMPYYNQLYESQSLTFDPLKTVDITTLTTSTSESSATASGENTTESGNHSESRAVSSETPQTMLSANGDYATAGSDATSDVSVNATSNETSNTDANTTDSGESSMIGYQGLPSDMLVSFRDSFLNIDLDVIESLNDLFMMVWNHGAQTETGRGHYNGY